MPKYVVYVERLVPQWRTVVVDCEEYALENEENQRKVFDAACNLDHWEYDDDHRDSQNPSKVIIVESTDDDPDVRI